MYTNIYYNREDNFVHLWDDEKGYSKFPHRKYGYILDPKGDYNTIDGNKVKKINNWTQDDERNGVLYETDVQTDMRVLIDRYFDTDEASKKNKELIFDIEVKSTEGFPMPNEAKYEITAIAYYFKPLDKYCVLILDEKGLIKRETRNNIDIIPFDNEQSLIIEFLNHYTKLAPNVLSGWNIMGFDVPYLYNRITNILGNTFATQLSPIGVVTIQEGGRYKIAGVSILDYMMLYKTFTYSDQPSYSLDAISNLELGHGKIKFDGTLDKLFETDIEKYIDYNLNDVKLVVELDKKLDFIDLAYNICHKGHVGYDDIFMPSKYIEGAALTFIKRQNLVSINKKHRKAITLQKSHSIGETKIYVDDKIQNIVPKSGMLRIKKSKTTMYDFDYIGYIDNYFILKQPLDKYVDKTWEFGFHFEGAYVKEPIPGLYKWVIDLDLVSMYPSNMMTLNISPETKIGKIIEFDRKELFKNDEHKFNLWIGDECYEKSSKDIRKFLEKNKFSLASNGVFYDTKKQGIIPAILTQWFAERVESKNLMKKYGKEGNDELYKYYKTRQLVLKVLLNTFYGVLGLNSFRFYDLDNAAATTDTGRDLIRFSQKMANNFYNNELGDIYIIELENEKIIELNGNDKIRIIRNDENIDILVKNLREMDDIYYIYKSKEQLNM